MATKKIISTLAAPKPIGPYSQAVLAHGTLYLSGQIGMDPTTSELVSGGIEAEAEQALKNMGTVLAAAGATYFDVVKATVFLTDLSKFDVVNNVYASYFKSGFPARSAFQVSKLPKGAQVEIEAIAVVDKPDDTQNKL